jgi:hypothetical protein
MYVDVRGSCVLFCKGNPESMSTTVVPAAEAEYLCLTKGSDNGEPPLLTLTFELINFLRIAPVVDYKPTSYLGGEIGIKDRWKL